VTFALTRRTAIASGLAAFAAPAIAIEPPRDITLQQDFDELWETLRDRYAFFEDKATDWDRVRAIYQPRLADVGDDEDKWNRLLLAVTDELYDAHTHLTQGVDGLPRWPLFDLFVEESEGNVLVQAIREGSAAQDAVMRIGDAVLAIDGTPIIQAAMLRMPRALRRPDPEARRYVLNAAVAGVRARPRTLRIRSKDGQARDVSLPLKTSPDRASISHRSLDEGFGYIAITTFGDNDAPKAFDAALEALASDADASMAERQSGADHRRA